MSESILLKRLQFGQSEWHVPLASGQRLHFWSLKTTIGLSKAALLFNDNTVYNWLKEGKLQMTGSVNSSRNGTKTPVIYIGADFTKESGINILCNVMDKADRKLRWREIDAEDEYTNRRDLVNFKKTRKSSSWKIWDAITLAETLPNMTPNRLGEFKEMVDVAINRAEYARFPDAIRDIEDVDLPF